ncbi:hypothetical protein HK096_008175, partial [Nowakowskiella sp. JEL0078]
MDTDLKDSDLKNLQLGTFPQYILEKLENLNTDLSESIIATSDVLSSLHNRSDVEKVAHFCVGTVSDGLGFVEALFFSKIDSELSPKTIVRRKSSNSAIPTHISERVEKLRLKAQEKNMGSQNRSTSSLQNVKERHDALQQEISQLDKEIESYIESLPQLSGYNVLSNSTSFEFQNEYGQESLNIEA